MKRTVFALLLTLTAAGCESEPTSDQIVPIESVPPNVMEAARKQLPGLTFDTVYKMKIQGKDSYEVRGKDNRGKIREVEVSATGEVIAIE
jgi:hypothetical protein